MIQKMLSIAGAAEPGRPGRPWPTQYFQILLCRNFFEKNCILHWPTQNKIGSAAPAYIIYVNLNTVYTLVSLNLRIRIQQV